MTAESGLGMRSMISELVKTTVKISEIEREYVPRAGPFYAAMAKLSSLERDVPVYIARMAQ